MAIVKPGKERNIASKLLKYDIVKDVSIVSGEYDLIIKLEVPDMSSLRSFLTEHLRKLRDIEKTSTMISMD